MNEKVLKVGTVNKRVLIVDDLDFIIEFEEKVIGTLSKELDIHIHVDAVNTVSEALKKIEENNYDAMVIDLNLPDGSGVEIAKASLKKNETTPIAALTIYPERYKDQRAYFDAYFSKSISPKEYKENLRHLLKV